MGVVEVGRERDREREHSVISPLLMVICTISVLFGGRFSFRECEVAKRMLSGLHFGLSIFLNLPFFPF